MIRLVKVERAATAAHSPPRIGGAWYGGIYAGVARGEGGVPDHYLIVLDEAPERLKWQPALDWARGLGLEIPTRRELALCYLNVRELFQNTWYWSSTQYAGYEASAWCQNFDNGNQYDGRKGLEFRARAVRRLPIE